MLKNIDCCLKSKATVVEFSACSRAIKRHLCNCVLLSPNHNAAMVQTVDWPLVFVVTITAAAADP